MECDLIAATFEVFRNGSGPKDLLKFACSFATECCLDRSWTPVITTAAHDSRTLAASLSKTKSLRS